MMEKEMITSKTNGNIMSKQGNNSVELDDGMYC